MEDAPPKTQINSASKISCNHANSSNIFLYKVALVTVFLVLLPLFPSLAPDLINQTLHARSWEFLQLIFVGIAVSYGLFSKKNEDNPISKMDNAQSYVSKLLQVSSDFDDDVIEESRKFQALNSQYYRPQPVVVVAEENPDAEETNGVVNQKPLILPVRSLKQSSSTNFSSSSNKSRDEEENVVLRSPIPWRSRSGRMEINGDGDEAASFSPSFSMEEQELSGVESRSFRSESNGGRKKSFVSPPPPLLLMNPVLMKSSSSVGTKPNAGSAEKVLRRSVPNEEEMRVGVRNPIGVLMKSVRPNEVEKESNYYDMKSVDTMQSYTTEEEEEDDRFEESSSGNGGPDVDKKADEFIAKFREQIRLQRIEFIRKSTAQRAGKPLR